MERANHLSAQDCAGRSRQELRHSGGAPRRFAEGNTRPGERYPGASGEAGKRDGALGQGKEGKSQARYADSTETADGSIMRRIAASVSDDKAVAQKGRTFFADGL